MSLCLCTFFSGVRCPLNNLEPWIRSEFSSDIMRIRIQNRTGSMDLDSGMVSKHWNYIVCPPFQVELRNYFQFNMSGTKEGRKKSYFFNGCAMWRKKNLFNANFQCFFYLNSVHIKIFIVDYIFLSVAVAEKEMYFITLLSSITLLEYGNIN